MHELSKRRKRRRIDYDRPIALSAKLLASWRIRIPKYLWNVLKEDRELTLSQAVGVFNAMSGKLPSGWRVAYIKRNGKIYVVKSRRPEDLVKEL